MKILLIISIIIISYFLIKDYQNRMVIVNANYQCNVAGQDNYCNYLAEMEYKGGVK